MNRGIDNDMKFKDFVSMWNRSKSVLGSTGAYSLKRDWSRLQLAVRYIGDIPMKDVTPYMIDMMYVTITEDKKKAHESFSTSSLAKLHLLMKQVFEKACVWGLVRENPVSRIKAPKPRAVRRRSLSMQEVHDLSEYLERDFDRAYTDFLAKEARSGNWKRRGERSRIRGLGPLSRLVLVKVSIATGMRLGELTGLSWEGVDFEKKKIEVFQAIKADGKLSTTKTHNGIRILSVDDDTMKMLMKLKDIQVYCLAQVGRKQSIDDPVFMSEAFTRILESNFEKWWRKWRVEAGQEDLKFHEIRHTQASIAIAEGHDVYTVANRLGNDPYTTLRSYTHLMPVNDREIADMFGRICA